MLNNEEEGLLAHLSTLVVANGMNISRLGAQNMVMMKLIDALIPLLTSGQREQAVQVFKESIEDVMCVMDDIELPADYHSILLDNTNNFIRMLRRPQSDVDVTKSQN